MIRMVKVKSSRANSPASKERIFNIPNSITIVRIMLVLTLPMFRNDPTIASIIAAVFILSDAEGMLARKLNQVTRVGAMLDKFADVLFIAVGLLSFVSVSLFSILGIVLLLASRLVKPLLGDEHIISASLLLKGLYVFLFVFILAEIWIDAPFWTYLLIALLFWCETGYAIWTSKKASHQSK